MAGRRGSTQAQGTSGVAGVFIFYGDYSSHSICSHREIYM